MLNFHLNFGKFGEVFGIFHLAGKKERLSPKTKQFSSAGRYFEYLTLVRKNLTRSLMFYPYKERACKKTSCL
jgi:hypothetical protein